MLNRLTESYQETRSEKKENGKGKKLNKIENKDNNKPEASIIKIINIGSYFFHLKKMISDCVKEKSNNTH